MTLTTALFLGLLALVSVPLLGYAIAQRQAAQRTSQCNARRPIPRSVWWVTGLLLGAIAYLLKPRLQAVGAGWVFFGGLLGLALLLSVLMLLRFIQSRRRPGVTRALSKARLGDLDAAVSDLQRQIESLGRSAARASALGDCYLLQEQWREAYIQFLDAEQLDGRGGRYLAKQAQALWKLDRGTEAIALLAQAAEADPSNPSHPWIACLVLADLGRVPEAHEQLERAARLTKATIPAGSDRRRTLDAAFDACRQRLARLAEGTSPPPQDAP